MIRPGTTAGDEGTQLGRVMTCTCWDCAAYRGHLLRRVALVVLLLGLSGGLAFKAGAWNGSTTGRVQVSGESMMAWL
jgi:hypothetical protein